MKKIILAFSIADTLEVAPEKLIEEIKMQLGFKLDMSQMEITQIDLQDFTAEELELIVGEPTPSEAIFAVLTALANSNEAISMSKRKDPTKALEVANKLIAANNWEEPREGWEKHIEFPQLNEDIDLRKKELVNTLFRKMTAPEAPVTTEQQTPSAVNSTDNLEIPAAPVVNADATPQGDPAAEAGNSAVAGAEEEKDPFENQ